jgi:hypothetical protein
MEYFENCDTSEKVVFAFVRAFKVTEDVLTVFDQGKNPDCFNKTLEYFYFSLYTQLIKVFVTQKIPFVKMNKHSFLLINALQKTFSGYDIKDDVIYSQLLIIEKDDLVGEFMIDFMENLIKLDDEAVKATQSSGSGSTSGSKRSRDD